MLEISIFSFFHMFSNVSETEIIILAISNLSSAYTHDTLDTHDLEIGYLDFPNILK